MRRTRPGWLARWLVPAGLWAALQSGSQAAPASHDAAPRARESGAARLGTASLPDTILARVGPRRVSVADFRRSWRTLSPPQRPDSLTPEAAREFLDLLIGKEALAERATREAWVWTRRESLRYETVRDQLTMRAALAPHLERARAELVAAGKPDDDPAAGVVARDRYLHEVRPAFDDSVLARLARVFQAIPRPSSDSGLFAQLRTLGIMPVVGERDSMQVLARTTRGPFLVRDLLAWWRSLSPILRPRVETQEQMRDVVANALFESELRRQAESARLVERPEVVRELAREREGFAVEHFVEREVYRDLPRDSTTLRHFFERDPARWALPMRVRVVRLELSSRAEAGRMGARLRDSAEVATLIGEPLPRGPVPNTAVPPRVRFVYDLGEREEPRLFREALRVGPGAVIGPDSTAHGWTVARVVAVIPARLRTFEEARPFLEHDWAAEEAERRIRALIERVRRPLSVRINQRALRRLTSS